MVAGFLQEYDRTGWRGVSPGVASKIFIMKNKTPKNQNIDNDHGMGTT